MASHFDEELAQVKAKTLKLGGLAETMVEQAVASLMNRDPHLAEETIALDHTADSRELEINEDCIRLLAFHQPAVGDLRFLTSVMVISADLERAADEAVNIAQRTVELSAVAQLTPYIDISPMSQLAQRMLRSSLDAFVRKEVSLALEVIATDTRVDVLREQLFRVLLTFAMEDPRTIGRVIRLVLVSRSLERVADHATNIAEMAVYLAEGKTIRHAPRPATPNPAEPESNRD